MEISCAYFKYVLHKCKKAGRNSADSLANTLLVKDVKAFWKEITNINQSYVPPATTIENITGVNNITTL